jgi:hypothetical protein
MTTKPLPSFRPIGAPLDVDDAALDRVGDKLGVPTLVKPAPARASQAALRREAPPAESPARDAAPVRAALEKLTIELPTYLTDAMKREALDKRTTVRHVVMLALQANGFEIAAADLVPDARRTRPKRR